MERVKKQRSISKIFAMYIVYFCIATFLLMAVGLIFFQVGLNKGFILPANYYEQKIENERYKIAKAENVKALIPKDCNYVVYDLNGKVLQGNTSEAKALDVWNIVKNNTSSEGKYFYKVVERENGICVVEYKISASFTNAILKRYIPNAELSLILLFFILFIIEIIFFSKCFRKRLEKEMKILKDTTEHIQMENLDFKIKYSKISEINEVLAALDKMKTELNESLSKQWKLEESRKEQIAALAHDIKTPLTIIKGNSELLGELDLKPDQAEFNNRILSEIENMESYIKALIEIMKSEKESILEKKQIDLIKFIDDIVKQGVSISINKQLKFKTEVKNIPEFIFADEAALKRAIGNVISNAVEYCPRDGEIVFSIDCDDKNVQFIIEDSGRGFTKEELTSATEQFFQGDKSRNSKNHYGMGLYIARNFIQKHSGNISLENSEKLGGAKVILKVPV